MSRGRRLALAYLALLVAASAVTVVFFADLAAEPRVSDVLQAPGWAHPFGTDSLGRDLLARLLVGAKVSLIVGLAGSALAVFVGVAYGLAAGWGGGWIDRVLMRGTDLLQSVPGFILVAVLCIGLRPVFPAGPGGTLMALVFGIALTHWMTVARVVRGEVLKAKTLPFVEAARALGGSDAQILRRHVVPHLAPSLWVLLGLQIPNTILYESFMSFIGIGVQPPQTSWGILVEEGWRSLELAPHLVFFPALFLFLTVWSFNVLFDPFRLPPSGKDDPGA